MRTIYGEKLEKPLPAVNAGIDVAGLARLREAAVAIAMEDGLATSRFKELNDLLAT